MEAETKGCHKYAQCVKLQHYNRAIYSTANRLQWTLKRAPSLWGQMSQKQEKGGKLSPFCWELRLSLRHAQGWKPRCTLYIPPPTAPGETGAVLQPQVLHFSLPLKAGPGCVSR